MKCFSPARCFLVLLVLVAGCSTDRVHEHLRADAEPLSDFLPNHRLLVKQPATFPFHYFYLKKNAPVYENVYIAPVSIDSLRKSNGWAEFDKALSGKLGSQVGDLRDFMRKAYEQAFRRQSQVSDRHLKVVDRADRPKTLVVETAIVAVKPTKAELNALGTAASFVVPGIGIVASLASEGSITVECRVRDARTGEIVAMYADTETDPKAVLPVASFTWLSSARINIKMIADQTAKVLAAKDSWRSVRRDFPVRFASLINDADLDE